jgi:hypothetical protein
LRHRDDANRDDANRDDANRNDANRNDANRNDAPIASASAHIQELSSCNWRRMPAIGRPDE